MSVDLEVLWKNREALLLAEVAAWLHDRGNAPMRFFSLTALDLMPQAVRVIQE